LEPHLRPDTLGTIDRFLEQEHAAGNSILPAPHQLFRALELTPPEHVRVVVLGQDPYPTPGHAHGLSFSVQPDVRPLPASLRNVFRELHEDLGIPPASEGCLEAWARAGVLLLNTVLSVRAGAAGSHRRKGWEPFTEAVLQAVRALPRRVVLLLWGNDARRFEPLFHDTAHRVIATGHPSPLSIRHFRGCRCFSRANVLLAEAGLDPIPWALPAPASISPNDFRLEN
jgi:uracil-DNA glycosylase